MHDQEMDKREDLFFTPGNDQHGPGQKRNKGLAWELQQGSIEELRKVNEELRAARRAALNLMEDAILSKEALRQSEEKYRTNLEKEVRDRTAELNATREMLQATLDSSPYAIQAFEAVRDHEGKIIDFTWKMTNHHAFLQSGDVIGQRLLQKNPGVIRAGLFEKFVKVTETGVAVDHEVFYNHEQFNAWFRQTLVKMGDGFVMHTEDITERKKAQEEIRKSRELLKTTIDSSLEMIQVFEAVRNAQGEIVDFRYVLLNQEAEKWMGDVVGESLLQRQPGVKEEGIFEAFRQVVETGEPTQYEKHYVHEQFNGWFYQSVVKLADGIATTTSNITARKRSEADMLRLKDEVAQRATDKYQALFKSIDEGLSVVEMIYDDDGKPLDMRWVETNPAFEKITGLRNVVGRRCSELFTTEPYWLNVFDQVAKTGESIRYENYHSGVNRWIRTHTSRVGGPGSRVVANVFEDITDRKQREQQQEYLLKLADALRPLSNPAEIQATAARMLGGHLRSDRAYYGEINETAGEFVVAQDWHQPQVASHARRFPLADWPMPGLGNGQTWVVRDSATDPALSDDQRAACLGNDIRAAVVVPLIKEGNLVATFVTNQATPRPWTPVEISSVEETAERTWAALERAKAEEALRKSEAKFRRLSDSGLVAVAFFDIGGPISDANEAFLQMLGVTREELASEKVRWDVYTPREWMQRTLEAIEEFARTGYITPYEKQFYHSSGELRWGIFAGATLEDGQTGVSLVVDITERKKAEENLYQREAQLSAVFKALPVGIGFMDNTGQMLFSNEEMHRYLPSNIMPSQDKASYHQWLGWNPDGTLVNRTNFPGARALRGEHVVPGMEMFYHQREGSGIWTRVAAVPVNDEQGAILGAVAVITDITEMKQTAEALQEREERLQKVLSIETVGVIYFDLEGSIHDANQAFERMSGYTREDLLNGQVRWTELTPPEFQEVTLKSKSELLTEGQNTPYEKQYIRPDGSRWWGLFAGRRLSETEYVEFVVDITDQKNVGEELKSFAQRLEQQVTERTAALQQTTNDLERNLATLRQAEAIAQMGSWEYNLITGELSCSEGMYRLFELPANSPVDLSLYHQMAPEEDRKRAQEFIGKVRGGEQQITESLCLKTATGTKVIQVQAHRLNDEQGRPVRVVGVDMDVTAAHQAEKTLSEQAHFIQTANEALPDILFVMELDSYEILYANHKFEERLGFAALPEQQGSRNFLKLVYEEDIPVVVAHVERMKEKAEEGVHELEYRMVTANGSLRWFRDRNAIFKRNKKGEVTEKIGLAQDVTERKRAEQELKESNLSLRYANENLQQFATIASHDLQEPLRKLKMFANVLARRYAPVLPPDAQQVIDKMGLTTDRMRQLIKEVLDYSRIAHSTTEAVSTNLDQIVTDVLNDLELMIEERGATVSYPDPLPVILALPLQMNQLFYNLFTNALKFVREEVPPVITITWRELTRKESGSYPQLKGQVPYIEVIIADNGIGFEGQFSEQIFQIFERLHPSDEYEGTGVGLALCKKIVENHFGHIYARSQQGAGASFHILLPAERQRS